MFDFGSMGGGGSGGGGMSSPDFAWLGLGIDASGAVRGASEFGRAGREVQATARTLERAMGPVTTAFRATLGALSALGLGMAGFRLGQFLTQTINLRARFEELEVSLAAVGKNAGYSREQLRDFEQGLMKTGISAIQSRQSLLSMMQAQLDLTQATKLARVAQDVAVVGQLNSSDALARMTHGIVSGQTEVLRTIGLNVQFEASYKKLAAELGKSQAQLTGQERVQARMNATLAQAATLTGLYEASMTSAGKQLRSTERYVQDLQVSLGLVFSETYTKLVFAYADALKDLQRWVTQNEGAIIKFGLEAAGVFEKMLAVVPVLVDTFRLLFDTLAGLINLVRVPLKALTGDFEGAARAWEAHLNNLTAIGDNLLRSESQIDAIGAAWARVDARTEKAILTQIRAGAVWAAVGVGPLNAPAPTAPALTPQFGFDLFKASTAPRGFEGTPPKPAANEPDVAEASKHAAREVAALRDRYQDLVRSFQDQTALETLLDSLADLRKRAAEVKLPVAEVQRFEDAVLRASGLRDLRDTVRAAATFAERAKDQLTALGNVKMKPLVDQLLRIEELNAQLRRSRGARRDAETDAWVRTELAPVAGQEAADRFQAQLDDVRAKRAMEQQLVREGINVTKATSIADEMVRNQRAITDAMKATTRESQSWLQTLSQVAGVVLGITSLFRNVPREMQQATQGAFTMLQGIGQLRGMQDAKGNNLSIGGALSGAGGAAGVLAVASGAGAVIGGVLAVAEAFDLFGTRARERARELAEAARAFNDALTAFGRAGEQMSAVQTAIRQLTDQAASLVAGAAAAAGVRLAEGARAEDYLTRAQVADTRARGEGMMRDARGVDGLRDMEVGAQLVGFAADLETILDTLDQRIRQLAPTIMRTLNQDWLRAMDRSGEAAALDAAEAWQERLTNLGLLLSRTAITQEEYAEAIAKAGDIYAKNLEAIAKAEAEQQRQQERAQLDFANTTEARIAAASGRTQGADDIRRAAQYENELEDARQKGYDTTRLLIAQELEWAQVREQRAKDAARRGQDRDLDAYVRDTTLMLGPVAGQLAGQAAQGAQRIRDLQEELARDESLSAEERARIIAEEIARVGREFEAFKAQFRRGFESDRDGLRVETMLDPVAAATFEATLRMDQAMQGYRDLLKAGIITPAEFAEVEAMWETKRERIVAAAKEQAQAAAEGFAVRAAEVAAKASGSAEDRFTAFALGATTAVEQEIRATEKLVEQKIITQEQFEAFAAAIRGTVTPAMLEMAFAAQEAARILQDNMTTLGQQWGVFGTDPTQQLADVKAVLGFGGMTVDEIRALFTKVTPGVELTEAQRTLNEKIATFFEYFGRAEAFAAQQAEAAARDAARATDTAAMTPDQEALRMLYTKSGTQTLSEGTGMRLVDIQMSSLTVLRSIDAKMGGGGAATGGVTVNVSVPAGTVPQGTARDVGQHIAASVAPLVDEHLGRRVGVDRRNTGAIQLTS